MGDNVVLFVLSFENAIVQSRIKRGMVAEVALKIVNEATIF